MHADGWILIAKFANFVTLGFLRFMGKSSPSSRRYRKSQISTFTSPSRTELHVWA